jgi:KaiC/GvpD/RAD55 family RecA-like ATPase
MNKKDKTKIKLEHLLKSRTEGLTIKEIMDKTGLARHTILTRLHALVGEGKVKVRQINMAKLHYWSEDAPLDEKELKEVFGGNKKLIEAHSKTQVEALKKEHVKEKKKEIKKPGGNSKAEIDMAAIKAEIAKEMHGGKIKKEGAQVKEQRTPISHYVTEGEHKSYRKSDEFIKTEIPGFDELFEQGIPKGSNVLVAGGAGSGKTIFTIQTLLNHAKHGEKCLYMSFEESEEKLIHHMEDFGWDPHPYLKKGNLLIKRFNPFDITRSVDALLLEAKGELLIDVEPIIFPEGFNPDIVVVDSLTAIASAFTGKEDSYRIYIEQLFRFFEKIRANTFLITETKQIPTIFSQSGVEEFLADGVIVLYNIKRGNVRENAIEVLKMRGTDHQKKIVAMQVTNEGMVVYPEQEVFSEIGEG